MALLILPFGLHAAAAQAQTTEVAEVGNGAAALAEEKPSKKVDWLAVPVPISNPSTGSGLVLAGIVFYNPNHEPNPWITGGGGIYTSTDTRGLAAFHSMSLDDDRIRIQAQISYMDQKVKFYGIGADAGDRNQFIELKKRDTSIRLEGQFRFAPNLYAGARYEYRKVITSPVDQSDETGDDPPPPSPPPGPGNTNTRRVSIAPIFSYDTRDNSLNAHKGAYVTASLAFNLEALGSDFAYRRFQAAGNAYRPLSSKTTLALRAAICGVSDGAPYYDLCKFGANNDLRGYPSDRYRDRASWAVQAEIRRSLFGRFGGVVFAGIGGIAPGLGNLDETKLLPAAGLGARYMVLKSRQLNVRVDYAVGRDSDTFYLSVSEAF